MYARLDSLLSTDKVEVICSVARLGSYVAFSAYAKSVSYFGPQATLAAQAPKIDDR